MKKEKLLYIYKINSNFYTNKYEILHNIFFLEVLIKNKGKPLTPEVIYKEVWGNSYGDLSAVAVYIQRLRKKIEEDSTTPVFIETVFGMGYRFND